MSCPAYAAVLALLAGAAAAQDLTVFTVGSGDLGGGYYETARALCAAVNREGDPGLRCSPDPTPGSIYNLAMLADGELDFAFAQSDWQRAAFEGTDMFAGQRAIPDLRSVMSLYPETVTILASVGSGISKLNDLVGKTVDIGPPASGRHATVRALLKRLGISPDEFSGVRELSADQSIDELCEGHIDAAILVIGHPNATVADGIRRCGLRLVDFDGPRIREVLSGAPDYVPVTIPGGTYAGIPGNVGSFAVYATIVTRADMPDDRVTALVEGLTGNLDALHRQHPVLAPVTVETARSVGLTAPLHPAAAAAYAAVPGG